MSLQGNQIVKGRSENRVPSDYAGEERFLETMRSAVEMGYFGFKSTEGTMCCATGTCD